MNKVLYFLLGAACGVAGTYFFMKDRCEKYINEEIDSVKHTYQENEENIEDPDEKSDMVEINIGDKPSLEELKMLRKQEKEVKKAGYKDYSTKIPKVEDPIHKPFNEEPYIIQPDEFGELTDYDKVSLIYYEDDVIAYEIDDEIFENAEQTLGEAYWEHFGEFEENAMYVRSDIDKTDYYISKDERTYEEVSGKNKPRVTKLEE